LTLCDWQTCPTSTFLIFYFGVPHVVIACFPLFRYRLHSYPAWPGQGLQARSESGRIADDIVLDNLADDDNQPGGDPYPHVEPFGLVAPARVGAYRADWGIMSGAVTIRRRALFPATETPKSMLAA
jgi:hypothetical protein